MFAGKIVKLPYSGNPEMCFTRVGSAYLQTLDYARKACQGQGLELITEIRKLRTKKFYNISPRRQNDN